MGKNIVVISAVNFTTGGPFTVLKNVLTATKDRAECKFIALVHSSAELMELFPWVEFIEYPEVKSSWVKRLYFEYITCNRLSKVIKATHWVCLHDITANVSVPYRFVYCHNPAPFYKYLSYRDIIGEPKFYLFYLFYGLLYNINIKKNTAVFVQQQWLKKEFEKKYKLKNVVVSRPEDICPFESDGLVRNNNKKDVRIFYPAVPRIFKNFEVIIRAAQILQDKNIHFYLTFDGTENKYAKRIYKLASELKNVHFLGYLNATEMVNFYQDSDIICFPSKLETWGLPLSEAKTYK
ncbi:TPA: glycosyltransferase family 4 protein, partial [Escherichia coli]|nr:glycosyltransferase family 4 protein [Escherichia coli]